MSHKRRRSLAPFAFCALVFILAAAFCVGYVSVYEANNPRIRQFDVDMAYSKGYSDGYNAALASVTPVPTAKPAPTPRPTILLTSTPVPLYRGEYPYVGNRHSWIFHYPNCPYVDLIEDQYRIVFDNRSEAIDEDYTPCLVCNP